MDITSVLRSIRISGGEGDGNGHSDGALAAGSVEPEVKGGLTIANMPDAYKTRRITRMNFVWRHGLPRNRPKCEECTLSDDYARADHSFCPDPSEVFDNNSFGSESKGHVRPVVVAGAEIAAL